MTEEEMIVDIKNRMFGGEELRDVARRHGLSCRAVCRIMAEVPEEDPSFLDSSEVDNSEEEPIGSIGSTDFYLKDLDLDLDLY